MKIKLNMNKAKMGGLDNFKYPRSENSLSTLTKKFVEMLMKEDALDLNEVNIIIPRLSSFEFPVSFLD